MRLHSARCVTLAAWCVSVLAAQSPAGSKLKQVIIVGRHAVRSPLAAASTLNRFSALPFPAFAAAGEGMITANGQINETLLGGYFRQWLIREKLLTGNDAADAGFVYIRADNPPLIVDTARAFLLGLLPEAPAAVHSLPFPDPLFDPVDAGIAKLDGEMAVAAVQGRLGGNPQSLATACSAEFALARSVLLNYPAGASPAPDTPAGRLDVTALPITLTPGNPAMSVNFGGLVAFGTAIAPFLMEYVDGMPASEVGWGRLDAAGISQISRVYDELVDLEFRTPYVARVLSSNLASHIVRSMLQAATGESTGGALGTPSDKIVVLVASNSNLSSLAGLFQLDWLVEGYQRNVAAPGGALVFELRQSPRTGEFVVRALYVAQTMDQLRNRTPLSLAAPPAKVPVFIPGCSSGNATFDCPLGTFVRLARHAIEARYAALDN